MTHIKVQVYNKSGNPLPKYETANAAGMDLIADVSGNDRILIYPGKRCLIKTGLHVAIPEGFELQIRPRSGLALKKGITVLNTPGTIDSDYRGEIGVILYNTGDESVGIANGERIAQAILTPVVSCMWSDVEHLEDLSKTDRGEGGFGSTGIDIKSKPIGENNMNNPLTPLIIENPDMKLPLQDNTLKNNNGEPLTE